MMIEEIDTDGSGTVDFDGKFEYIFWHYFQVKVHGKKKFI